MWVSLDRIYLFCGDVWDFPLLGDTLLKGFDSLIVLWKVVESGEKWRFYRVYNLHMGFGGIGKHKKPPYFYEDDYAGNSARNFLSTHLRSESFGGTEWGWGFYCFFFILVM